MGARRPRTQPAPVPPRTPSEEAFADAHDAATKDRTQRALTFRANPRRPHVLEPDTPDLALWKARLAATFGGCDVHAQAHLLEQAASVFWRGDPVADANAAVALVRELAPQGGTEAMLAVQMVAVHNAALEMLRRALLPDQPAQFVDSTANRATRLLRLFADQTAALERLRDRRSHAASAAPQIDIVRRIVFVASDGRDTDGLPLCGAADAPAWLCAGDGAKGELPHAP